MTPDEFISRAIGMPWVKWRSDWQACDCFGLVLLWWREVHGVDLGEVPRADIAQGFAAITGWEECGPEPNATGFMSWRNGSPTHCGILVSGGMLLHVDGSDARAGTARLTPLTAMRRLHSDLRFYRPAAWAATKAAKC